ncbi:MAG: glutamyl-tRNA reductase, partial [Desulfatiglandales bacterium]
MTDILLLGVSYKTAPVEIRERFAQAPDYDRRIYSSFRGSKVIREGLFLSTCNRFEILTVSEDPEGAREEVLDLFRSIGGMERDRLVPLLYEKRDKEAIAHIFRVASSLDSMVIGEPQILGQIKEAYRSATEHKTTGVILNRLMHRAFHTAKRVRTETGISESAVSVSYAAVELAKRIFNELKGKCALLVGAGEMGELAAKHLVKGGISRLLV